MVDGTTIIGTVKTRPSDAETRAKKLIALSRQHISGWLVVCSLTKYPCHTDRALQYVLLYTWTFGLFVGMFFKYVSGSQFGLGIMGFISSVAP